MRISRRLLATCVGIYLFSQLLFLINIQFPRGLDFDEFHYVPSAKQFLKLTENQNWEHPPLAKEIMAVGIGIWGDRPIGWRFMSTVFGALTLVGMYLWALALFGNPQAAFFSTLLTLVNMMLYVQARIGMLDTFMVAFMVWGLAAFTAAWRADPGPKAGQRVFAFLAFAGLMFGLAAATKWFAVIPWFLCVGLIIGARIFKRWNVVLAGESRWKKQQPGFEDWYSPSLLPGFTMGRFLLCLFVIPVVAYFLTFIPFLFVQHGAETGYSLLDILKMQPQMWDGQQRVVTSHPYMSSWWGWIVPLRPIWYAFDHEGSWVRGVIMLGNPLIMWTGLLAVLAAGWAWLSRRSREGFLIFCMYAAFYLPWAIIPRKVTFYYYYYPAGMVLSLALTFLFFRLDDPDTRRSRIMRWVFAGAAVGLFVHFFPIIAALKIGGENFRQYMWFMGWI